MTPDDREALYSEMNALGQPIGRSLPGWVEPPWPPRDPMRGRFCHLEPIDERHAADLYAANSHDKEGHSWTYLPYGPFATEEEYCSWLKSTCFGSDPFFHAIVDTDGHARGVAAYMRIVPSMGCIEVGHVHFSPLLQRTPAATEAMYLMMKRVFELGYRRYEWKCDALNEPSRSAAQRLGFSFEGIFRQAVVYKRRNRDTAWYAATDNDWSALARAFETWLAPSNFDANGHQKVSLSRLTLPLLVRRG